MPENLGVQAEIREAMHVVGCNTGEVLHMLLNVGFSAFFGCSTCLPPSVSSPITKSDHATENESGQSLARKQGQPASRAARAKPGILSVLRGAGVRSGPRTATDAGCACRR